VKNHSRRPLRFLGNRDFGYRWSAPSLLDILEVPPAIVVGNVEVSQTAVSSDFADNSFIQSRFTMKVKRVNRLESRITAQSPRARLVAALSTRSSRTTSTILSSTLRAIRDLLLRFG
jgi:hypothetical protein